MVLGSVMRRFACALHLLLGLYDDSFAVLKNFNYFVTIVYRDSLCMRK